MLKGALLGVQVTVMAVVDAMDYWINHCEAFPDDTCVADLLLLVVCKPRIVAKSSLILHARHGTRRQTT